jgi:hypothetical protein
MNDTTTKMVGDAGEHYALSRFIFAGRPGMKAPDGWPYYDLAVASEDGGLIRISVKTRSETRSFSDSSTFSYDETSQVDWVVAVAKSADGVRAWVVPYELIRDEVKINPSHEYRVSLSKLKRPPFDAFEDNWTLSPVGRARGDQHVEG